MAFRAGFCLVAGLGGWGLESRGAADGSVVFYLAAFLSGGWDLAWEVWFDLKRLRFDTHFLMLLVVPGSMFIGAWGEAALLLFLFSASAAMEAFASHRTRREIASLFRGAPKSARVVDGGVERDCPVEELRAGQVIRLVAGEQVPVDAEVLLGESACDESTLTGESIPIPKVKGAAIYAGTLNVSATLEARVLRPAAESTLQRIINLIESAQHLKAPVQRFTDRFGTGYTFVVLSACLVLFMVAWKAFGAPAFVPVGTELSAFYRAMTLLVVLSPCALVLSVPSAILSAIACGARHGVLFRGGAAIENLGKVKVVAMDKTGTLTEGNLRVLGVDVLKGGLEEALGLASVLARGSSHPISRAILLEAHRVGLADPEVISVETLPGKGLVATWRSGRAGLGNREWIAEAFSTARGVDLPPPEDGPIETWVVSDAVLARIRCEDRLRATAPALVSRLRRGGVRTVMLTGDRAAAAGRMAKAAGVDEVRSGLKPEGKVAALQELRLGGRLIAMVGDGVNDAPCLAAADVGVAMGARGSDAAIEQAEVVLMHDRLENFLFARELSVRARRIIGQNLTISLGTMGIMALVAVFRKDLPLWLGVAAHEGSTAVVVVNSLRLLLRPPHLGDDV